MMIVGGEGGGMTDAALHRGPLVAALVAGIGIDVIGGEVETGEEVGGEVELQALDVANVAVLIEGV